MKLLLVGAEGFIGSRLRGRLEAAGAGVTAASSRDGSGLAADTGLPAPAFRVPEGTQAVVYLAASPFYRRVPETAAHLFATNALSAVAIAEQARAAGARRFVYASTGNVYAPGFGAFAESAPLRRDDWYALSKVHAEEALALFRPGLEIVLARLFGVYGPGQTGRLVPNLAQALRASRPIDLQVRAGKPDDRDGLRLSLCYVDDVAEILARFALDGGPEQVNVAGDEVLSVRAIATELGRQLGVVPQFESTGAARASDLIADNSLLKRHLSPRFTPFEQGIARTAAALR